MRAYPRAGPSSNAFLLVYKGLPVAVHFHFAGAGAAAHTNVFQRAAKTGTFMPLKMRQRNKNIRIHHSAADFRLPNIGALHGDQCFIGSLQAVCNQNMAAGCKRIEAVGIGGIQMSQGVFSAADVKGVAIG